MNDADKFEAQLRTYLTFLAREPECHEAFLAYAEVQMRAEGRLLSVNEICRRWTLKQDTEAYMAAFRRRSEGS